MGSERRISEDAVRKATGKGWSEWLSILDAFGGRERSHAEMARYLKQRRGASAWWSQAITVRYELERGLRKEGQKGKTFDVSVSRTIRASAEQAFDAWTSAKAWNAWFTRGARVNAKSGGRYSNADGDRGEFLRVDRPRRIAFTWENETHCPGTRVQVDVLKKAKDKVQVVLTHSKLATPRDRQEMRGGWSWALDSLRSWLETGRAIPSEEWEPS
jgi:uncharacterized protein YndB with AHSA1/START domain